MKDVVVVGSCFADVDAAVSQRCFDTDAHGYILASPVVVEPWFLNSSTFTRRLLVAADYRDGEPSRPGQR